MDISPYLLREAKSLALKEGVAGMIDFQEGNAESLPFPDNSFDVVTLLNVLPEADADRILAELIRVTSPKGRVAVATRAEDMPFWVNLPIGNALKMKVEAPGGARAGTGERGCSDASLYQRFHQVGLTQVKMLPQLVADYDRLNLQFLQGQILPSLTTDELKEWESAVAQAEEEGTFFIARPFHCAVGTRPR
jgi:ubiquinone/menaquinone biosynthesis C-methylase UbiE